MTEWTVATLKQYTDALREADQRALRIKEEADTRALELAREIQVYKDEKANELRAQIGREQGERATKAELGQMEEKLETEMKPALDWVASRRGRDAGGLDNRVMLFAVLGFLTALGAILAVVLTAH